MAAGLASAIRPKLRRGFFCYPRNIFVARQISFLGVSPWPFFAACRVLSRASVRSRPSSVELHRPSSSVIVRCRWYVARGFAGFTRRNIRRRRGLFRAGRGFLREGDIVSSYPRLSYGKIRRSVRRETPFSAAPLRWAAISSATSAR